MTITERIFVELSQKNIAQKDFATKIDVNEKTVSAWKRNNSLPPADKLSNISDCLGITLDYLLTGEERVLSLPKDEQELINYYKELPTWEQQRLIGRAAALAEKYAEQVKGPDIQLIPTYYVSNRVSAGFGEYLEEYEQGKTVYVPDTPKSRKADFVLTVSGDSMEPKFHDGDNILVRSQPTVDEGQIGIFDVDGEGYIKKLGKGELISLNHKYPNISLKDKYVKCFGVVLGTTEIVK